MSVVVDVEAVMQAPRRPAASEGVDAAEALEDIIAAHRAALVELAPHQAERAARVETGWHMEHLGRLLCLRDSLAPMQTENPAPSGVHLPERGRTRENTGTDHLAH